KKRKSKTLAYQFSKKFEKLKSESNSQEVIIQNQTEWVQKTVQGLIKRMEKLASKSAYYKKRYSSTPSIWPVYGRIRSNFGYRTHPISGKRQFHKGIDIPSWLGAPIKAAADGVVYYRGWYRGYGLLVALDHGYGYKTVYAHCSKILVKRGQLVKKGQLIANVGSSGISTGPHLHYEIRKWGKALSPKQFLDIDLFTAGNRLW
ncbi:MAG: M23 family metallopeptidase, partial [Candidatus Margulisbacteria bacterium]|nr:M23 family metallopeptidase [Candidatus Margulisiibacteriota bacterium]